MFVRYNKTYICSIIFCYRSPTDEKNLMNKTLTPCLSKEHRVQHANGRPVMSL